MSRDQHCRELAVKMTAIPTAVPHSYVVKLNYAAADAFKRLHLYEQWCAYFGIEPIPAKDEAHD